MCWRYCPSNIASLHYYRGWRNREHWRYCFASIASLIRLRIRVTCVSA
jgi:hypothetical protein